MKLKRMNRHIPIQMRILSIITLLIFSVALNAQDFEKPLTGLLDSQIYKAPEIYWEPLKDQGDVKALFYETLSYKGKATRAFAYIGIPESKQPVPAMVLVHGGGGKAFYEWVKIWNDRGYAAISMSLEGHMPDNEGQGKLSHEFSGPKRVGRFDDVDLPIKEQWMYHAVSDIILAHSLLASLPEIDADRIGITGISWGGILSSLVSGVDQRLKCAIPVYGCGFLYESLGHFGEHGNKSPEFIEQKKFWDPARQFASGSVPILWVNSDSDGHFSLNCTSHSFEIASDHSFLTIHPNMPHGHKAGWNIKLVPEIYTFADNILKGEKPGLGRITKQPKGRKVSLTFESETAIKEATVYYLNEKLTYRKPDPKSIHFGPGPWLSLPAEVDKSNNTVEAELPETAVSYYVNLKDERGFIISSVLVEIEE